MSNCFIIPIYQHHDTITKTVEHLLPFNLAIIIADDGSDATTKAVLQHLATTHPLVDVVTLPQNGGKGAAIHAAMGRANERGFTHALQIDADGQHDTADIPRFWQESSTYPNALISGMPLYDASMPRGRRIGRQFTHFWVHIETLSFDIKDSMLGFRVYPVKSSIALMQKHNLGKRMDFDPEIMVRLYWDNVPVRFIPTKVIYPEGGKSHFNMLKDNWLITKMHTRLFFGMLLRFPKLLVKKRAA